ncbi:hypothetical protein NEIPOLOT_02199 [Neisseria polysaccharea ATCC 43768]|nr:hypothetical protein NEIPOLOT_02199 [Neisseria polysaccharea ATCC 43768]
MEPIRKAPSNCILRKSKGQQNPIIGKTSFRRLIIIRPDCFY